MELVGTVIKGQYAVREVLGEGGMGTVFRAEQLSVERPVAIKVMRPEFLKDEAAVKRFQREAKLTSRLSHPNTIRLFDFGFTDDGLMFLVMELLDGRELADEVKMTGAIPVARALRLTLQIAQALRAAHKLGIVHRDLKPTNVFLARDAGGDELLKVMDFGIAKSIDDKAATQVTQAGTIVGTPAYMSPEQAKGITISANSDIYSLGIILFELLTGTVPFSSESMIRVLMMHVQNRPPPLADARPELAAVAGLQETLDQMLTKDAAKRPDAVSACKLLEKLLDGPAGKMATVNAALRVAKTVEIDDAHADDATAFVDAAPDTVVDAGAAAAIREMDHHVHIDGAATDDATAFADAVGERTARVATVPLAGASVNVDGIGADDATAFVDSVDEATATATVPIGSSVQVDGSRTDDATAFVDSVNVPTAVAASTVKRPPVRRRSTRMPRGRSRAPQPAATSKASEQAAQPGSDPTGTAAAVVAEEPKKGGKGPIIAIAAVVLLGGIGAAVALGGGSSKQDSASSVVVEEASKTAGQGAAAPADKPEAAKPEPAKNAPAKEPAAKPAPAQRQAAKAQGAKPEAAKPEAAKPEAAKLEPPKPEPAAAPRIPIVSKPLGADVLIAGKSVGKTPTSIDRPAAGTTVNVTLRLAGHKDGTAAIPADLQDPVIVTLAALPKPARKARKKRRKRKKRTRDADLMMD